MANETAVTTAEEATPDVAKTKKGRPYTTSRNVRIAGGTTYQVGNKYFLSDKEVKDLNKTHGDVFAQVVEK